MRVSQSRRRKRHEKLKLLSEEEEGLKRASPGKKIIRYFSRQPIWDCGFGLIAITSLSGDRRVISKTPNWLRIASGSDGDRRVISVTPNWPRMALGSDLIDCRGCAVWPSDSDLLHLSVIGTYAKDGLGISKRICPFGGENSTAKQVIHQGALIEVFPQFHYAVLVVVDVEKFGFLKADLIYWIRECGLVKDFSAMVEAEARFPQEAREDHGFPISPWTDLTTYNGWARSFQEAYEVAHHGEEEDHHKQSSTHEKDEEPTLEEEHSLPVMRLIGRGIYHNLTNHIRRSKAAAIINEGVNAKVMSRIREVVYGNNTDLPPLLSELGRPYLPSSFCPRLLNEVDPHDVEGFDKAWDEWEARVNSV